MAYLGNVCLNIARHLFHVCIDIHHFTLHFIDLTDSNVIYRMEEHVMFAPGVVFTHTVTDYVSL